MNNKKHNESSFKLFKSKTYFLKLSLQQTKRKTTLVPPPPVAGYRLFLNKLKFSYDCLDRIVINGYITSFHTCNNLTYYFKFILGHLYVSPKLLLSVTKQYNREIEALARNGVRKEEFVRKYRKFSNFLRYELTCNNLPDLKLKKRWGTCPLFRRKLLALGPYCETEAEMMKCHADADYFQKHASPVLVGQTKIAGLQVYHERTHRLLETLLHDHRGISEWKTMWIYGIKL